MLSGPDFTECSSMISGLHSLSGPSYRSWSLGRSKQQAQGHRVLRFILLYECILSTRTYVYCVCLLPSEDKERMSHSLDMESQSALSHMYVLRTEPQVFCKISKGS